ncbi:MAG: prepilin-type N-terminal cleavage/methylation domain-containing protein [Candidatus Omnitrophica bacterium]|nr:prepilin-type N-terminal cleavage/methylation domain-containing protein [Candidatus Omnitrophota bacterium]MDD5310751.1 prepilin-type N-terminal cleavage/methylation domain-containing protein [Candidatus Omnitrophota bacterium]MDD5545566.1 prepilin-type N-terminal cleavage/methylation domain-containing protein [Candidatus Omnitrophota bacterium]
MRKGFTLIEIVISLAILAVGLVGILSLFPIGFDSARRSMNSTQVAIFANEKLEELRNTGFPSLGVTSGAFSDASYAWSQSVSTVDAIDALRKVDLTVTWEYRSRPYQQVFTTYVATR